MRLLVGDMRGRKAKSSQVEHAASDRSVPPGSWEHAASDRSIPPSPTMAPIPMELLGKDSKAGRISTSLIETREEHSGLEFPNRYRTHRTLYKHHAIST